jgi:hypothetical protein
MFHSAKIVWMRSKFVRGRTGRLASAFAVLLVLALPVGLFAWGEVGHRVIGEVAARRLPPSMPAFFRNASKQLGYLNPEPDRWRDRAERAADPALDGGAFPEHFIDMEMAPAPVLSAALKAPDRFGYLDTLAAARIKGQVMGLLPFQMLELAQRVRLEFRLWRSAPDSIKPFIEARILNDAGILGHYVADGANPAHTTIHFNGWSGANPNGYATDRRFHARVEAEYVDSHITTNDVLAKVDTAARVLPDLRAAIIAYLTASNGEVERTYQIDKAHPFGAETTAPENKVFITDRLAAGARMLRDIWWTAWVTSAEGPR